MSASRAVWSRASRHASREVESVPSRSLPEGRVSAAGQVDGRRDPLGMLRVKGPRAHIELLQLVDILLLDADSGGLSPTERYSDALCPPLTHLSLKNPKYPSLTVPRLSPAHAVLASAAHLRPPWSAGGRSGSAPGDRSSRSSCCCIHPVPTLNLATTSSCRRSVRLRLRLALSAAARSGEYAPCSPRAMARGALGAVDWERSELDGVMAAVCTG